MSLCKSEFEAKVESIDITVFSTNNLVAQASSPSKPLGGSKGIKSHRDECGGAVVFQINNPVEVHSSTLATLLYNKRKVYSLRTFLASKLSFSNFVAVLFFSTLSFVR